MTGLWVETALLLPVALPVLLWLGASGRGHFSTSAPGTALLLAAAGIVTAVPLVCFVAAARRMTLTALGFFQYLAPSCHFVLAVAVYHEPFSRPRLAAFVCIWAALALLSVEAAWRSRPSVA